MKRIQRSSFLYMEPRRGPDAFAQCAGCRDHATAKRRCAILGPAIDVEPQDTCGAFIEGSYSGQPIIAAVTPKSVGFLKHTQVRCEHCHYGGELCGLFQLLNQAHPQVFDLDPRIHPKGCCNAWTKPDEQRAVAAAA